MAVNERFDFSDRCVLITGGGKGIGKVYVEEFAKAGARVAAADIDVAAAESVAASLSKAGLQAFGLGVDISDEASVSAAVAAVLDRYGKIDVLINNASLMSTLPRRSFWKSRLRNGTASWQSTCAACFSVAAPPSQP